jgi:hypothetical protein
VFIGAPNVPSPLPSSTEMFVPLNVAVARSGRPSALKSPLARANPSAAAKSCFGANVTAAFAADANPALATAATRAICNERMLMPALASMAVRRRNGKPYAANCGRASRFRLARLVA